jgi:hypothetical protein
VGGAQGRPLVLPNTGGGEQLDMGPLAVLAGLVLIGGGAYFRRRATQR